MPPTKSCYYRILVTRPHRSTSKYRKRCLLKKSTYANNKYIISNEFNTKRLLFVTFSRGIIQKGVEYLTLFLFDTHFTSIVRRYQL